MVYSHAQIPLCSNAPAFAGLGLRRFVISTPRGIDALRWRTQTLFAIPKYLIPTKSDRPELNWRFHVGNVTSYRWTTVAWRREVAGAPPTWFFRTHGERPQTSGLTIGTGENRTHVTALRERCSTTELQCRCISISDCQITRLVQQSESNQKRR